MVGGAVTVEPEGGRMEAVVGGLGGLVTGGLLITEMIATNTVIWTLLSSIFFFFSLIFILISTSFSLFSVFTVLIFTFT